MDENQKFEQIWGFRKNIDSSSDDSKSNSVGNGQEKLGLVPILVSNDNDRVSETSDHHTHVQVEKKAKRARNGRKKEKNNKNNNKIKKKREVKSKSKKDSCAISNIKKGVNSSSSNRKEKKSKLISQMTVSDDFRIFTKSILEDLRVSRETMFAKMRKEMDQIMKSKPSSRSKKKKGSANDNNAKKPNQKPRSRKPKTTQAKPKQNNESKGLNRPQEPINHENAKDPSSKNPNLINPSAKNPILIDSSARNPILIDSSAKNPILINSSAKNPIFTNAPDKIVTSSYLIPLVLPNSRSNDTSLRLERGNYSVLQGEERIRSFAESSSVGNGYPVGSNHHQRFDNSNTFGIPNRAVHGFSHDGNRLGTRMMNGGSLSYSAGLAGHTLPNHLASNGFLSLYQK